MLNRTPFQSPATSYRIIDGDAIIIDHRTHQIMTLNSVASRIWGLVDGRRTIREIAAQIQSDYGIEENTAIEDAMAFLTGLATDGLIETPGEAGSGLPRIRKDKPSRSFTDGGEIMKKLSALAQRKKSPLQVILELTQRCHLSCKHCYLPPETRKDSKSPDLATGEWLGIMDQLAESFCFELIFTGGEPFLRRDFFDLVAGARERRFSVLIKTSGTLVNEEKADRLAELFVSEMHFSLYHMDKEKHDYITGISGSWERTVNAIKLVSERGIRTKLSTPITKYTMDGIDSLLDFAEEVGARVVFDTTITPMNNRCIDNLYLRLNPKDLRALYRNARMRAEMIGKDKYIGGNLELGDYHGPSDPGCGAGHILAAINPYGDVIPCTALPTLKWGNLRRQSFREIWDNSLDAHSYRKIANKDLNRCSACGLKTYCNRCPGVALMEHGDLFAPSLAACAAAGVTKSVLQEIGEIRPWWQQKGLAAEEK
ncbi:MAG: radical SAM protein [Armatimonadetes bacterium]|nr:radical SAM protein [Armatimonadota bacterium]